MTPSDPDALLRVLRGLLRPLVRTLIRHGVTAPAFYRLLKRVYVEVAADEFGIDGTEPTDSRITLLTGVHRRDVRDIRAEEGEGWEAARAKSATFATVLGQWIGRAEWQDGDGLPRALPRSGREGADFDSLVRSVNRDIRPRTILDELLRQGIVSEGKDGLLRVAEGAVLGPASDDHKMIFFAANVGDHLAAAAENLRTEDSPFLERAVFYNRLTAGSIDRIEGLARELSQKVLEELNAASADLQKSDGGRDNATERYRFGVYFYREDTVPSGDESEGK